MIARKGNLQNHEKQALKEDNTFSQRVTVHKPPQNPQTGQATQAVQRDLFAGADIPLSTIEEMSTSSAQPSLARSPKTRTKETAGASTAEASIAEEKPPNKTITSDADGAHYQQHSPQQKKTTNQPTKTLPEISCPPAKDNVPTYSVTELLTIVKRLFARDHSWLRVEGEVSQLKRSRNGHLYFYLRDDRSSLSCAIWASRISTLELTLEEGMLVHVYGKLVATSRAGIMIDVVKASHTGIGALLKRLEELRQRLSKEGLFAEDRKKPLPILPRVVGVITSPTGAVIHDMYHRMQARCGCTMVLWPITVQGLATTGHVVAALHGFNMLATLPEHKRIIACPEVIVIARGGGSTEDLLPFSSEPLLRAVAMSAIPVISAIGHETDHPLLDEVADCRAATPTAAMEILLPVRDQLINQLKTNQEALARLMIKHQQTRQNHLSSLTRLAHKALHHRYMTAHRALIHQRSSLNRAPRRVYRGIRSRFLSIAGHLDLSLQRWQQRYHATVARITLVRLRTIKHIDARVIPNVMLTPRLAKHEATIHGLAVTMKESVIQIIKDNQIRAGHQSDLLRSLGYQATLTRGFALALDSKGNIIRTSEHAKNAKLFQLQFAPTPLPDGKDTDSQNHTVWVTITPPPHSD